MPKPDNSTTLIFVVNGAEVVLDHLNVNEPLHAARNQGNRPSIDVLTQLFRGRSPASVSSSSFVFGVAAGVRPTARVAAASSCAAAARRCVRPGATARG
jgi:hypothetical protein